MSNFSVNGTQGLIVIQPNTTQQAGLPAVAATGALITYDFALSALPTLSGTVGVYAWLRVNGAATTYYRVGLSIAASGAMTLQARTSAGASPFADTVVAGTYSPGTFMNVKVQVVGTNPTTLSAKAWVKNTTEPAGYAVTGVDSGGPQGTGYIGLQAISTGGATTLTVTVDDYDATVPGGTSSSAPDPPTGVTGAAGNASAVVTFSPPGNNGGQAVTGYRVTPLTNGQAPSGIHFIKAAVGVGGAGDTTGTVFDSGIAVDTANLGVTAGTLTTGHLLNTTTQSFNPIRATWTGQAHSSTMAVASFKVPGSTAGAGGVGTSNPVLVQRKTATTASGTTVGLTLNATPVAGNLLVASMLGTNPQPTTGFTNLSGWTRAGGDAGQGDIAVFFRQVQAGDTTGPYTFTQLGAADALELEIEEWTGWAAGTITYDLTNGADNNVATTAAATVNPGVTGPSTELVKGILGVRGTSATAAAWNNGMIVDSPLFGATAGRMATAHRVAVATVNLSPTTATWTNANLATVVVVTFRVVPATSSIVLAQARKTAVATSATTIAATFDSAPTAGNLLVATVCGTLGQWTPPAGWSTAIADVGNLDVAIIWRTAPSSASAGPYTFTQSGGVDALEIELEEWTGFPAGTITLGDVHGTADTGLALGTQVNAGATTGALTTTSGASSPITVGGLTNGIAYTFTVAALNSVGYSAESAPSGLVTPTAPGGGGGGGATGGMANAIGMYAGDQSLEVDKVKLFKAGGNGGPYISQALYKYASDNTCFGGYGCTFSSSIDNVLATVGGWKDFQTASPAPGLPTPTLALECSLSAGASLGMSAAARQASLQATVNGANDADFTKLGQRIVSSGLTVVVRLGHEANAGDYPWGTLGIADDNVYVLAFRRAVGLIRAQSPTTKIDWNGLAGVGFKTTHYPGDQWVDIIGADFYDVTRNHGITLAQHMSDLAQYRDFAIARGKQFSLPEWALSAQYGSTTGGATVVGDNPDFIQAVYDFCNALPATGGGSLAYHSYFHADPPSEGWTALYHFPFSKARYAATFGAVTAPGNTAPTAPLNVVATAGNGTVNLTWSAPSSNGGTAITNYTITPRIGGVAQTPITTGAVLATTVTGLTNGTAYTFTLTASNNVGTGPTSAASNAVTPAQPGRFTKPDLTNTGLAGTGQSIILSYGPGTANPVPASNQAITDPRVINIAGGAVWAPDGRIYIEQDGVTLHNIKVIGGLTTTDGAPANNFTLQYCQFQDPTGYLVNSTGSGGPVIDVIGSKNVVIDHNEIGFNNKGGAYGIRLGPNGANNGDNVTITFNNIHHNNHHIQMFGGATNVKIKSNFLWGDVAYANTGLGANAGDHTEQIYCSAPVSPIIQGNSFYISGYGDLIARGYNGGGIVAPIFCENGGTGWILDNNWFDTDPNATANGNGPPNEYLQTDCQYNQFTNNQFGVLFGFGTCRLNLGNVPAPGGQITTLSNNTFFRAGTSVPKYGTVNIGDPVNVRDA